MPSAAMSSSPSVGRVGGVFALGCAVAVVVAACGPAHADAHPSATAAGPTATGTPAVPSPTPSPTSIYAAPPEAYVKPARPAILDGKPSEDAAIAFAKYYLKLVTYAYLSGDPSDLVPLGEAGCVYCLHIETDIAREYGGGGHDEGGAVTVEQATAIDYEVDGFFVVKIDGTQDPVRELDAAGRTIAAVAAQRSYFYQFALYWKSKVGWQLAELSVADR